MARSNIQSLPTIQYFRGDTNVCRFLRTVSGVAIDITGFSYLLTVSRANSPSAAEAAAEQIMQLTGVVDPDQNTNTGQFDFQPSVSDYTPLLDADFVDAGNGQLVANLFYDVQETQSGGAIETLGKGDFQILMDITK